tara:strand:- start:755 stop:973 length:219 start_codon:yes stop_codon:yes gene_type:complete
MSCKSIKDPVKKARCLQAQSLLKKHTRKVATEAMGGKGSNISGTMHYGHGTSRDSITFNDGSVKKILKNKKL